MSIITSREQRREMARESAKWPASLKEIPRSEWPNLDGPQLRVLRSREYLVQEFGGDGPVLVRLSINRTQSHRSSGAGSIPNTFATERNWPSPRCSAAESSWMSSTSQTCATSG